MSVAGALLGVGAGLQMYGQYQQGKMAKAMGRLRRKQLEKQKKTVQAQGQRAALEERRQAELLASRAIAVAAAGGGSADDGSISKIIADIEGEGAYRAAVQMYNAEQEGKQLSFEGLMAEKAGVEAARQSRFNMLGTALSAGASMYAAKSKSSYG